MHEVRRTPWFLKDGYLACTAYYSDGTRRTIHQHRELVEQALGRPIRDGYVVHHKDGTRANNALDNLEEKLEADHLREHRPAPEVDDATCPMCEQPFQVLARQVRNNQKKQGRPGPFCGRTCAGRFNAQKRYAAVGEPPVDPLA